MSSPKAKLAIVAKKKALRPNPDRGKDVAVPRLLGQLNVAGHGERQQMWPEGKEISPVLMAAEKEQELPNPVKKEQSRMRDVDIELGPQTYAWVVS